MDINQLQSFQTIIEMKNLTKAADKLHISQPALSASLSRLEHELGYVLFDRVSRRLQLNDYGQIFAKYAANILQNVQEASAELARHADSLSKRMTVYSATKRSIGPVYVQFKRDNPDIVLRRVEVLVQDVPRCFQESDCDFVTITCADPESFGCEYIVLQDEPLMLAVPRTSRLAGRKSIRMEELKEEKFVAMPSESSFRRVTDKLCEEAGFTPHIINECYRCQLINYLLGNNAVAFVSHVDVEVTCGSDLPGSSIVLIPIENAPYSVKDTVLWDPNRPMTQAGRAFLRTLREMAGGEEPGCEK